MGEETLEFEKIVPTIEKVKNTIIMMETKLSGLDNELQEKEHQLSEREQRLDEQLEHSKKLEAEYLKVQEELSRISSLYSEISGKQQDVTDVTKILGIYITLLEKVFAGKPHAKILFLLHGGKNEMKREDLTKSTGFAAAAVRYAISELANADLIGFDEETETATLKERLYD